MTVRWMEGAFWEVEDLRRFRLVGYRLTIWVEWSWRAHAWTWSYAGDPDRPVWFGSRGAAMRDCVETVQGAMAARRGGRNGR
jgi:hypothetical protein